MTHRLLATPLAAWERDGLAAALVKAGLPADDVGDPNVLFWRFESYEDVPVGFGGLEVHGSEADFFSRLGYAPCVRGDLPDAIRETGQFAALGPAAVMVKKV